MTQGDGPYAEAWRRYRRWRLAKWSVFLSFVPGMALLVRGLGWNAGAYANAVFVIALVWMIAFAIVGSQTANFACPRCGKPFFRKFDDRPWVQSWARNPFARQCMHCGLPKWASA